MKKLLILGAALLGLCTIEQTARAGGDYPDDNYGRRSPDYSYERPAPRYYEGRVAEPRCYLPPPPPVCLPPPRVVFYGRPHYRHRHYYPYAYGYGPGVHIGIGF